MQPAGARLSIDYGTATTVAMLALPSGGLVPVLVDGTATVPSGVFVDPGDGRLVAGGRGQHLAMSRPDCYVSDPKRHLTAGKIHLAGHHINLLDLVAAT